MNTRNRLVYLMVGYSLLACAPGSEDETGHTAPRRPDLAETAVGELDTRCRAAAALEAPGTQWAADTSLRADFNYDGSLDLAIWGTQGDSAFVLAIVECADAESGRVWSFPFQAKSIFGTVELEVLLENPARGEGGLFEECVGRETSTECRELAELDRKLEAAYLRGGRGLSVGIPDRDRIHLYWHPDSVEFEIWRL